MSQNNQEIYEGLFNTNENFKNSFPTLDGFEQYVSTSPTKIDKIYSMYGTPPPIATPAVIDEPVKKKERGSLFRSLFSGGKSKNQDFVPEVVEPVPTVTPVVEPIENKAITSAGPLFVPEKAIDEFGTAFNLNDDALQEESFATFGPDAAQGLINSTVRLGEIIANSNDDLKEAMLGLYGTKSIRQNDVQWEAVKLAVSPDVIAKQARTQLTYALLKEKQPAAKKAAKFFIETSLMDGNLMTEEIGKYMDQDTKEEKGFPILTQQAKQLVVELSENKDLSIYNPVERSTEAGTIEVGQALRESRIPNAVKIDEYALRAFKSVAPTLDGYKSRSDGSLIASDEEMKNDPRFRIIKEELTDMVTDGIQRDNYETAFSEELRKEFPDNKEIQEKGIAGLQPGVQAMLQNTAGLESQKIKKEFDSFVASKSVPFLEESSKQKAFLDSAYQAFNNKYGYLENIQMYTEGSKEDFEKDKKTLTDLFEVFNKSTHDKGLALQNEINEYQQTFVKDRQDKLMQSMKLIGQDVDSKIKRIALQVGQEITIRQQLAEGNAYEENSLGTNMVNAYAAGQADMLRGYSLMLRTFSGGTSEVSNLLENLADAQYKFETSVKTQWYKSKDENGKDHGFFGAIKDAFKDLPTASKSIESALVETSRMAPSIVQGVAVGATGAGIGATSLTAFASDTSMEMAESYKNTLATTGDRRIAEKVSNEKYKKQLGLMITYLTDGVAYTPKSMGKVVDLTSAMRVASSKLAVNQVGETYQEIEQGYASEQVKSEILDLKPMPLSFTEYSKENALDLSLAVLPQTLLFGSASSISDSYTQITEEKRAQNAIRLFDELGFTNYIHSAVNDLGRNGALSLGETMFIQGQITKEQAEKYNQAVIRLTEFSQASTFLASDSAEKSHTIVGLMNDKYEQQASLNTVTTDQAKDQIKDSIKKIDAEIENVRNGKMSGYSVIKDTKTGRIIASLSDNKLKKLIAPQTEEAFAFLTQVALGGFELNTQDTKIMDVISKYKTFLNNQSDVNTKRSNIQKQKDIDLVEAAERRKNGEKFVPTDEEINKKADSSINNLMLESFLPVFVSQTDISSDLKKYKEKQVVDTGNINIPSTIEINENTTPEQIDNFILGADNHYKVNMAIAQMKSVMPILQQMFPNAKIIMAKTDADFQQITGSATLDEGFFYQGLEETYEGSGTVKVYETADGKMNKAITPTIYLNLQRMTEFTLYHETVHAGLLKAFGADPNLMRNFKVGVDTILSKDMKKSLDKWLNERNYDENIKDEEYLAQLGAFLKSQGKNIKMTMWQQLKGLIVTVLNKAGFKSLENRVNSFYDAKQIADFFNQLTKGTITGATADSFVPAEAKSASQARRSQNQNPAVQELSERAERSGMVRSSSSPSSLHAFQQLEDMMNLAVSKYGFKKNEDTLEGSKKYTDARRDNRMVHFGLDKSINIAPNANLTSAELLSVSNRLMFNIIFQSDKNLWNTILKDYSKANPALFKKYNDSVTFQTQSKNLITDEVKNEANEIAIDTINDVSRLIYQFTNNSQYLNKAKSTAAEKIWDAQSIFFLKRPVERIAGLQSLLEANSSQESLQEFKDINFPEIIESAKKYVGIGANEQVNIHIEGLQRLIPEMSRKSMVRMSFATQIFKSLENKFKDLNVDIEPIEPGQVTTKGLPFTPSVQILTSVSDVLVEYKDIDDLTVSLATVFLTTLQKTNIGAFSNILKTAERNIPEFKELALKYRNSLGPLTDIDDLDIFDNPIARKIKNKEIIPFLANVVADSIENLLISPNESATVDVANEIIDSFNNNFNERDGVDYTLLKNSFTLDQMAVLLIDPRVKLEDNFIKNTLSSENKTKFKNNEIFIDLLKKGNVEYVFDYNAPYYNQLTILSSIEEEENKKDFFTKIYEDSADIFILVNNLSPSNNIEYIVFDELLDVDRKFTGSLTYRHSDEQAKKEKYSLLLNRFFNNMSSNIGRSDFDQALKYKEAVQKIFPFYDTNKIIDSYTKIPFDIYYSIVDTVEPNKVIMHDGTVFLKNKPDLITDYFIKLSESKNKDMMLPQKGKFRDFSFEIFDDQGVKIDTINANGNLRTYNSQKGIYVNFKSQETGYGQTKPEETKFRGEKTINTAALGLLRLYSDEDIKFIEFTPAYGVNPNPRRAQENDGDYRRKLYNIASKRMQGDYALNLSSTSQVIPISPMMRLGTEDIFFDTQRKSSLLNKSQIRKSQSANHQKIKQNVDSMRQQNIADNDIFASLYNTFGYEDMRTSAFGTDFMNAADSFIDKKAEDGLNKYAAEFAKRQTGIRNFLDQYAETAPLITLVNQLRQGVPFIDDSVLGIEEGQLTFLTDPLRPQLRSTKTTDGKIYKFADYEIFRALFDAGETSSTLSQIFGPQFRETVQRVIDRKELSSDILNDISEDARSLKVKKTIDELRELGEVFDDMDASAIVQWLVGKLATGGVEEAVQNIIDRLKKATTFPGLQDQLNLAFYESAKSEDIQALSGLGSFAGRVLRLLRQVAEKPEQIIVERAESRGLVIPPRLKEAVEKASREKMQAYEQYKEALRVFLNDFSDLNGLALMAAEKNYDDKSFEFARTVNVAGIQPNFWSNNIIKSSAFGLLSVNTLFVSGVSVVEILVRSLNLPSALTRFIVDKFNKKQIVPGFQNRAAQNPFTKEYWRTARNMFAYTAQSSFLEMARIAVTGQQQNKTISLTDQPSNMNVFRDAHNIVTLFYKFLQTKKQGSAPLSTSEIADILEVAMIEVNTGSNAQGVPTSKLQLADSYSIFNTFFRGVLALPAFGQGELMLRLMPLGLDKFGANAIAMNSMLTYINLQMENDYQNMPESLLKALQNRNNTLMPATSLPSVAGQTIGNVKMDEVTLQKNLSRLMTGLFATGQMGRDVFETEALKATFFNDNSITRGMSSVRTNLQNTMQNRYYSYLNEKRKGKGGSLTNKATDITALHLAQMGNVAQFAVLPFVKVPSNIGAAVLVRGNPISALLASIYFHGEYNKVFSVMKDKYKLTMDANTLLGTGFVMQTQKATTAQQQMQVEKDMMELYEAKRKYLQSIGDITASTIFGGAVYLVAMSGAVTSSDDPDKRTMMNEMGLRFSELNITYLLEYLSKSKELGEFVDGDNFARTRGKSKPDDLRISLINLGTYFSYGLGFATDLYQAAKTGKNESNSVFAGFKSYFSIGTIFQNMTRSMFKMTPSVKFIEDVLQVIDTGSGNKDYGKTMDDIIGGLIATAGGGFAPALLGKPLSVSESQVIQSPQDIEMSKEIDQYVWPLNLRPILIGHLRMSRNGLIFPGSFRSDFYKSGIGNFGEDLTLRKTLNAPNTGAAYFESMLNFFSMRREAVIAPNEAEMEFVKHQNVQSFVSGIAYLGSVYFQLKKDPTDFYKVFNRRQRNAFIITESPEGDRGENFDKQVKLPNDIMRDEARILGSYRYTVVEDYNVSLNNFIEEVKKSKVETEEDKENLAVLIKEQMNVLAERMKAVENQYQKEFIANRANDIAVEMFKRKVLVKNDFLDERNLLEQAGITSDFFNNASQYKYSLSYDKQGKLINQRVVESLNEVKKKK